MLKIFIGLSLCFGLSMAGLYLKPYGHSEEKFLPHMFGSKQSNGFVPREYRQMDLPESSKSPSASSTEPPVMNFPKNPDTKFLASSGFDGGVDFSRELYQEIARNSKNKNIIVSPFSAYLALMMASYGARGNTEKQMIQLLKRPEMNVVEKIFPKVLELFNQLDDVQVNVANTVFASKSVGLEEKFRQTIESMFQSKVLELETIDKTQAARQINNWVEDHTNHNIKDVVKESDINDGTLALLNAIYFKAPWKKEFYVENTVDDVFHVNKETKKTVKMMKMKKEFLLTGKLPEIDAEFVVLPYTAAELEMVFVIPNRVDGLSKIEENIQRLDLENLKNRRSTTYVNLEVPKFKIENTLQLNNVLSALGMTEAFTNSADFSGMTNSTGLKIEKVLQKTYVDVNEKGTEAAAVTVIAFVPTSLLVSSEEPKLMRVDRPSYFMINYKNINLFSGRLYDPEGH